MTEYKAVLIKDVSTWGKTIYKKGTHFKVDVMKEYWDDGKWTGEFKHIGKFKSDETISGIHSIELFKCDYQKSAHCLKDESKE